MSTSDYTFNLIKIYLVPAKVVPDKRRFVGNMERAVLIEHGEFTAAAGPSGQPNNNRVLHTMSRFEKEIEHPANLI